MDQEDTYCMICLTECKSRTHIGCTSAYMHYECALQHLEKNGQYCAICRKEINLTDLENISDEMQKELSLQKEKNRQKELEAQEFFHNWTDAIAKSIVRIIKSHNRNMMSSEQWGVFTEISIESVLYNIMYNRDHFEDLKELLRNEYEETIMQNIINDAHWILENITEYEKFNDWFSAQFRSNLK